MATVAEARPQSLPSSAFLVVHSYHTSASVEQIITKRDPDRQNTLSKSLPASLFQANPDDFRRFLLAVYDLQRSMRSVAAVSGSPGGSGGGAARTQQRLMQAAMRRLEAEFTLTLSLLRDRLDPRTLVPSGSNFPDYWSTSESNSPDDSGALNDEDYAAESLPSSPPSPASSDGRQPAALASHLRAVAECMVSAGYARECIRIYRESRKAALEEGLNRLRLELFTPGQVQKLDHDSLDRHIAAWVSASRAAVRGLFGGEEALCDLVFGTAGPTRETCFSEVARDAGVLLLGFPELAAERSARGATQPEAAFPLLEMYRCVADLMPDVAAVFSCETTAVVRSQAEFSLKKLGKSVRSAIAAFELVIQKCTSKRKDGSRWTVPGGGVHPLSKYAMDFLTSLADYAAELQDIFLGVPLPPHASSNSGSAADEPSSPVSTGALSVRYAWLVTILLCKLDVKAESYKDAPLSYLFLANNLRYITGRVRRSSLSVFLGRDWVAEHERKARSFASSCQKLAWAKALEALPVMLPGLEPLEGGAAETAAAEGRIRRFNKAFEEACRSQSGWVVFEAQMKEELLADVTERVVKPYRSFYDLWTKAVPVPVPVPEKSPSAGAVVPTPEDLLNKLSALYTGKPDSEPGTPDGSSKSRFGPHRIKRRFLGLRP